MSCAPRPTFSVAHGQILVAGKWSPDHIRQHPLRARPGIHERRGQRPVPERCLHNEDVARALVEAEGERVATAVRAVPPAYASLGEPLLEAANNQRPIRRLPGNAIGAPTLVAPLQAQLGHSLVRSAAPASPPLAFVDARRLATCEASSLTASISTEGSTGFVKWIW
jgi:hypothetical protein